MSAHVLITGQIFRAPEQRTSKAGKPFVTATIRVKENEATVWWKVITFSESNGAELMRLSDGDAVSVQGSMKAEVYEKDGEPKLSLTVFADAILLSSSHPSNARKRNANPCSDREAARAPRPSNRASARMAATTTIRSATGCRFRGWARAMNIHHHPPAEAFRAAILDALGAAPSQIIGDGKAHRFSVNGKKRDDAGEYRFYDDAFAAGYAKDYRSGAYFTWSARGETTVLSDSDRTEHDRIIRERKEQREREQAEAARLAMLSWQEAKPADPAHPYLARKGVRAHGLRQDGDKLLVPVMDGAELISVQTIAPDGSKLFPLNTRVKGGSFTLGAETDVIYVVEGYATGATVHELTGSQTIIAFNSSNLLAVAPKIRASNYQAHIMIIGDDDFTVDKNPGLRDATKAAKAIGGYLAIPPFDRDAGDVGTDFNDLHALHGSRAVQDAIDDAFAAGPLKSDAEQETRKEQDNYNPPGEPLAPKKNKFKFESVSDILANFNPSGDEWLVKKFLPKVGVGTIFGMSMTFKSFAALDMGGHVANGWPWADRKTKQGPVVYIAAEGAAGVRKRLVGFHQYNLERGPSPNAPLHMTPVAPNLGTGQDDLKELIAAVEANCPNPTLVVLDTAAQSLGGADENGQGMAQLLINAIALSNHFRCFVLMVHHVGLSDDQRMRGWSGLKCGIDVEILCERELKTMTTTLSLKKLKDEETNLQLAVSMDRIVIGHDEDGDEVSTLVVADIKEETTKVKANKPTKSISKRQRLLMEVMEQAIKEDGKDIRSFSNGTIVRAVADGIVRERLYARIAEQAEPGQSPGLLAERQRKHFNDAIKATLEAKILGAVEQNGERFLWTI